MRRLLLLAAACLAARPVSAQETEEILSYAVTIDLQAGGWMEVREEIQVVALGDEIRRGIYRDFPTRFPRRSGLGRITAPFEVLEVLRDGRPEPYVTESVGGPAGRTGIRVRIGHQNRLLERGEHLYTLVYRTARWMSFGAEGDELYWNVTGSGWSFPIREASARIFLPGSVPGDSVTLEGWTGAEGSTAQNLTSSFDAGEATPAPALGPGSRASASFRTTAPLGPYEGLTIRMTLPKGVVAPPSEEDRSRWFRMDWGPLSESAVLVGLILSLYLLMWVRVGRDPPERPVVVQYEPPLGFGPAALGYLEERGWNADQLTAAVVSLGVQGAVSIERTGRKWTLRRQGGETDSLAPEEARLLKGLLPGSGSSVTLSGVPNGRVRKAVKELRKSLKRQIETHYLITNRGWFLAGLAATGLGFALLTLRARFSIQPEGWFLGLWLSFWTMGVGTLLVRVYHEWSQALSGDPLSWVTAVFLSLFSLPFVGAEIFVGYILYHAVPFHLVAATLALGGLNVLFYHLLERPTLKGQGILDEIEGFRRFLSATEEDRMNRLQPAHETLELFERFLPFAIALGVENRWAERFEGALEDAAAATAASGGVHGGPLSWYSGGGNRSLTALTGSLGGALSSSLSASSASPSSSGGGGGGGGSSGGGGGGGGGGGW